MKQAAFGIVTQQYTSNDIITYRIGSQSICLSFDILAYLVKIVKMMIEITTSPKFTNKKIMSINPKKMIKEAYLSFFTKYFGL